MMLTWCADLFLFVPTFCSILDSFPWLSEVGEPSLEDISRAICPEEQPYKCLPYGRCYGHQNYCDPVTNTVESCFPQALSDTNSLLNWCRQVHQNKTRLLHSSCRFACDAKFGKLNEVPVSEDCSSDLLLRIIITVLAAFLLISFVYSLYLRCCQNKLQNKVTGKPKNLTHDVNLPLIRQLSREEREQGGGLGVPGTDDLAAAQRPDVGADDQLQVSEDLQQSQQLSGNMDLNLNFRRTHQAAQGSSSGPECNADASSSIPSPSSSSFSSSSSVTSAAVSDDSGNATGGPSLGRAECVQNSPATRAHVSQGQDQQSLRERCPDMEYHTNASSPDQGYNEIVTNISLYNRE